MSAETPGDPVAERFDITFQRGVVVVTVGPKIESIQFEMIDQATRRILAAVKTVNPPKLIFDMSRVQYFGSVFISLLIRCWKRVGANEDAFGICGVSPTVREVFFVSRMHQLWAFYPNLDAALNRLAGGANPAEARAPGE